MALGDRSSRRGPSPARRPIRHVSVVVLTWNGLEDTLSCLDSLRASTWPELDVIVVDNASADGTEQAVALRHPEVTLVQTGSNLGFAGGNNAGIRVALDHGADAVFVLNNDTCVPAYAVERLVRALDDDPMAGACSPVIHYANDPGRWWFAGSPYDPRRARAGRASEYERGGQLPRKPVRIDRAAGAAMVVRAEVIRAVGAFAEELFYLYEDVDWSLRIRAVGWHILLVPDADVAHKVAASQGGMPHTPTTAYYGTRNDLLTGQRHGDARGARALWRELACVAVHLAGGRHAAPGQRARYLSSVLGGWRDFRAGRLGARAS
jgi:GT2 family glycosyltransferase